jgi:hypothetical protein
MKKYILSTLTAQLVLIFLTVLVVNASGQGNLEQEYKEAMDAAKKILNEKIAEPPVPPDINLKCAEGTAADKLGGVYIEKLIQPEADIVRRLLSVCKKMSEVKPGSESECLVLAGDVYKRNLTKTLNLIRKYKPKPEKFIAVASASLTVCKEAAMLGVDSDLGDYAISLGAWAEDIVDKYLDELRKNHDYRAISVIFSLSKTAHLLGSAKIDIGELFEQFAKAAAFRVDFEVSCWISAGSQRMMLKGSGIFRYDGTVLDFPDIEARGKYESYTNKMGGGGATIKFPNAYTVEMKLTEIDWCGGSVTLLVDKIGADKETWIIPELSEEYTAPGEEFDLFVNTLADQLFQEYRAGGGRYKFTMPIHNLQAEMCNESYTKTGTVSKSGETFSGSISYNVTITHIPK